MNITCKVCGTSCVPIVYKKIESMYHGCPKCDFISKDASCYISESQALSIYQVHNNSADDAAYQAYFRDFIHKCISGFVSGTVEALDFGSGPEPVLAHMLKHELGYLVDVYDKFFSPYKVYEGKQYDLITSTEVVEHLEEPVEYFKLFHTLLKPGGHLAVMTQFHPNDVGRFENWHYRRDDSHVSFFTPKTMSIISEQVGFEIVFIDAHKNATLKRI